ncbi:MAG: CRISPR-associated helicase Cas3' [Butyricicoccus sp.]|nr:CRISPR-associated helicase Cas3' [Butyricicoccus sp.]
MKDLKDAASGAVAKSDPDDRGYYLPLWMHAQDTSSIMELLCQKWLAQSTICFFQDAVGADVFWQLVRFLGLTHDIGKLTAVFQSTIRAAVEDASLCGLPLPDSGSFSDPHSTPHAMASEAILLWYGCPPSIAQIVGAHHGKPQSVMADTEEAIETWPRNFGGRELDRWKRCWRAFLDAAMQEAGFPDTDSLPRRIPITAQMVLTGLLIMADWIASNTKYFPLIAVTETGSEKQYPARVETAWETLDLPDPWIGNRWGVDESSFENRFGFPPNPMQTAVMDILGHASQPGILVLEAQMGTGKTEAALVGAEQLTGREAAGGLFFGLPTQATANGLFPRICAWAADQSRMDHDTYGIRLAHGTAALNPQYRELFRGSAQLAEDESESSGLIAHSWFEGRKQALLADFVVGTVDQVLMAALRQKHVMLRHLGLAGKTVIIDEVHAYNPYMNCYLDRILTWLGAYGVPVIALSATLPAFRRREMFAAYLTGRAGKQKYTLPERMDWLTNFRYPLLTWTDGMEIKQDTAADSSQRRTVQIAFAKIAQVRSILREKLNEGGCAGVIVNTVQRAQQLAQHLRREMPEMQVIDFHSQFIMTDRIERETLLIERLGKHSTPVQRDGMIIVGTQVLEQSLDIDFDLLLTDLCPMDLLLQRIGRLQRHVRVRPEALRAAQCIVLESEELEPGACAIYGEWPLLRTRSLLKKQIQLPEDIPALVQAAYSAPAVDTLEEEEQEAWQTYQKEYQKAVSDAERFLLRKPGYGRSADMAGMLDYDGDERESGAQASVRGGDPSIEVLVLFRDQEGRVFAADDPENPIYANHVPSVEECRHIARQRLRLSGLFSRSWRVDRVIRELEQNGCTVLQEWQQSAQLRGELFLLLDQAGRGTLCGCCLQYTEADGLCVEKGGET